MPIASDGATRTVLACAAASRAELRQQTGATIVSGLQRPPRGQLEALHRPTEHGAKRCRQCRAISMQRTGVSAAPKACSLLALLESSVVDCRDRVKQLQAFETLGEGEEWRQIAHCRPADSRVPPPTALLYCVPTRMRFAYASATETGRLCASASHFASAFRRFALLLLLLLLLLLSRIHSGQQPTLLNNGSSLLRVAHTRRTFIDRVGNRLEINDSSSLTFEQKCKNPKAAASRIIEPTASGGSRT